MEERTTLFIIVIILAVGLIFNALIANNLKDKLCNYEIEYCSKDKLLKKLNKTED